MTRDTSSEPTGRAGWAPRATRRAVLSGAATAGLGAALGSPAAAQAHEPQTVARVVSYYTSWSRYDREYYPEDVPLDRITDLNFAFLTVEEDGTVTYADEWGDQENLAAFRDLKADHSDTRFYLSVGGWSDSTYFSNAAATPENRERFASTAIEIVREYDFDGIDVDWEYPGGGGAEGNVTREDGRDGEDDRGYGITMAASANANTAGNLLLEELEPYLEYVTVMTYDFAGSWSDYTGHNAPLHGDGPSVADSMAWWADQPIPREKLFVGLPFYGRAFEGVEIRPKGGSTEPGGEEPEPELLDGLGEPFGSASTARLETLDEDYPLEDSYSEFRDDEAEVPYRYSDEESTFVSYEDADSIAAKAEFARLESLGGVTVWEQAGDPDGELLAAVQEALTRNPGGSGSPLCGDVVPEGYDVIDGQLVCDLDDDGLHRDVNGDGEVAQDDVVQFFESQHREAWKRPELFDFSGSDSVGHGDVVALFEYVST